MTKEKIEAIQALIYYYDHHKVSKLIETRPGFVVDDFSKLLDLLRTEVFND